MLCLNRERSFFNFQLTTRHTRHIEQLMEQILPRLCFHLAEQDNWSSIQRSGLLPASRLMDRAGVSGETRKAMEHGRREQRTVLPDGTVIRDNRPLPLVALDQCLVGMSPAEWFAMLNSKVFFWFDLSRLERQRWACRAHPQVVMVFETAALLAQHEALAAVTPINTGSAMRKAALRGMQTFVRLADWRSHQWTAEAEITGRRRRNSHRPVELAIAEPVPEAMRVMRAAYPLAPNQPLPQERLKC
jgi:hypothetical protein